MLFFIMSTSYCQLIVPQAVNEGLCLHKMSYLSPSSLCAWPIEYPCTVNRCMDAVLPRFHFVKCTTVLQLLDNKFCDTSRPSLSALGFFVIFRSIALLARSSSTF